MALRPSLNFKDLEVEVEGGARSCKSLTWISEQALGTCPALET